MFPKTDLGITQALYLGSIHGHYWNNKSITQKWENEVTMTNEQIDNFYTNKNSNIKINKLHESSGVPKENQAYRIHLNTGYLNLTNFQIRNLEEYWKTNFNKTLLAVVTVDDINDRDDIYDMRSEIYKKLDKEFYTKFDGYSSTSISIGFDCEVHSAFRAGSTFRHHGRVKDLIYVVFNTYGTPREIRKVELSDD